MDGAPTQEACRAVKRAAGASAAESWRSRRARGRHRLRASRARADQKGNACRASSMRSAGCCLRARRSKRKSWPKPRRARWARSSPGSRSASRCGAPRDYAAFAREGFMQNAIVYRSVRMIAEAAASVPLLLYDGARRDRGARAARSLRAPIARPDDGRLPRGLVRLPARRRQRLRRGGGGRAGACANCTCCAPIA